MPTNRILAEAAISDRHNSMVSGSTGRAFEPEDGLSACRQDMGGETTEAWRVVLDDLVARGLRRPEFLIVDGGKGLDAAITTLWDGVTPELPVSPETARLGADAAALELVTALRPAP